MEKFWDWLSNKNEIFWFFTDDIYDKYEDMPKQMLIGYMFEYLFEVQPDIDYHIVKKNIDNLYIFLKYEIEKLNVS